MFTVSESPKLLFHQNNNFNIETLISSTGIDLLNILMQQERLWYVRNVSDHWTLTYIIYIGLVELHFIVPMYIEL